MKPGNFLQFPRRPEAFIPTNITAKSTGGPGLAPGRVSTGYPTEGAQIPDKYPPHLLAHSMRRNDESIRDSQPFNRRFLMFLLFQQRKKRKEGARSAKLVDLVRGNFGYQYVCRNTQRSYCAETLFSICAYHLVV